MQRQVRAAGPAASKANDDFALGVVALLDVALVGLWADGGATALQVVALHSVATGLIVLILAADRRRPAGRLLGTGALLILLGPMGGPTMATSRVVARWLGSINADFGDEPHEADTELPAPERIYRQILQGRRYTPTNRCLARFEATLCGDDAEAQYATISTITRNYAPEMRPALALALRSPNAALRVQAAAVFAKLRTSYGDRATEILLELKENPRGSNIAALAAEARTVANSGFVEEELKRHLLAVAKVLESRQTARHMRPSDGHVGVRAGDPTTPVQPSIRRYSCGGMG